MQGRLGLHSSGRHPQSPVSTNREALPTPYYQGFHGLPLGIDPVSSPPVWRRGVLKSQASVMAWSLVPSRHSGAHPQWPH